MTITHHEVEAMPLCGTLPTLDEMRAWPRVGWFVWKNGAGTRHFDKSIAGPGVYAIWHYTALLYVGYSSSLLERAQTHLRNWHSCMSEFPTHITCIGCDCVETAAALEAELILAHDPPKNKRREPKGGQVRRFAA